MWTLRLLAKSMKIYEAIARNSVGRFSVRDQISIADLCLVPMLQSVSGLRKRFDESYGYPTIGRIVKTCEEIDAFRTHGSGKSWQVGAEINQELGE